ncbi:small G-protein Ras2 [Helicostylum pulchrum]|nr:small G-protein Ras2 [Helicostylum pulchrum]
MMLFKIVVLGDGGVGKTALTIQLCLNHFVETYDPTIEDSYRKQVVIDDFPCVLEVLDTAGQEEYTALRDQWIRDGEGFLIVYSITSRSTYDRVNKFRDQIFRVKDLNKVPLILVGNKSDKVTDREVSREEGALKARTLNCDFVETSAKTCVNVERSFYSVVRLIRQSREGYQDGPSKNKKNKKDKKCNIL